MFDRTVVFVWLDTSEKKKIEAIRLKGESEL